MSSDPPLWMFSTISIYFLLKFVTTIKKKFIVLTAIFIFLAFMTKILASPLYLITAIGLTYFIFSRRLNKKEILKTVILFSSITAICFIVFLSISSFNEIAETLDPVVINESILENEEIDDGEVKFLPLHSKFIQLSKKDLTLKRVTSPHFIHTRLVKFSISGLLGHGALWAFEGLPVDAFFWLQSGKDLTEIWSPGILYHVADIFLVLAGIGLILLIKDRKRINILLDKHHFVIIFSSVGLVIGILFFHWLLAQVGVARYTFFIIAFYGIILTVGWYSVFKNPKLKWLLIAPLIFLASMSIQNMIVTEDVSSYSMRDYTADGIMDNIDREPGLFSNDFIDIQNGNEITGTILNRIEDSKRINYNKSWGLNLTAPITLKEASPNELTDDLMGKNISLQNVVEIIIKNESPNFEQILNKIPQHLRNEEIKNQVNDIVKELESEGKIIETDGFWESPIQNIRVTKVDNGIKIVNDETSMQNFLRVKLCNDNTIKEIPSKSAIIFSCDSNGITKFQEISYEPILPHGIKNGDLIQSKDGIKVYLVENGVKRHITEKSKQKIEYLIGDAFPIKRSIKRISTFDALGFTVEMIKYVPEEIINEIPDGKIILKPSAVLK